MNPFYSELEKEIIDSYESGTTLESAEKLAAKFLHAQLQVSSDLQSADLDARMRKSGCKAIKSAVRTAAISKQEKKPTEGQLEDVVNMDEMVMSEQKSLDEAEVLKASLERYYDIFREAHIFFRGVAKGRFNE